MKRSPSLRGTSLLYYYYLSAATKRAFAWSPSFASFLNRSCLAQRNMASRSAAAVTSLASASQSTDSAAMQTEQESASLLFRNLRLTNSWIAQLSPETPDNMSKSFAREHIDPSDPHRNNYKRPVYNGHYVLVNPVPLPAPRLLLYSHQVAFDLLQLTKEQVESPEFCQWVSGGSAPVTANAHANDDANDDNTNNNNNNTNNTPSVHSWATPYALAIMGTRYYNNCPYSTGDGYGDGRAISIGEIETSVASGSSDSVDSDSSNSVSAFELQLKGAGPTPFCRGADGRAVLRSSVREFLASEAMFHLGVATTRALSLVVDDELKIARPWYGPNVQIQVPQLDDPRLQQYTPEQKQALIMQLRNEKVDPNVMRQEPAAITCRVAQSFVRIGHLDLFARRAIKASRMAGDATTKTTKYKTDTLEWKELVEMVWHACYRDFRQEAYDPFVDTQNVGGAAQVLLTQAATQNANMVAHWIRVGFAQGNFNSDNNLVSGTTMDYGPFGFMEEYNPLFAKWTGSGQHFGFMNQPTAGFVNYQVLVESVAPIICVARGTNDVNAVVKEFMEPAAEIFQSAVDAVFRTKLGFEADQDVGDDVWEGLEKLMRKTRTDWTLFFRQLTYLVKEFSDFESQDYEGMMKYLVGDDSFREGSSPFYELLTDETRKEWVSWMEQWRTALASLDASASAVYERMRTTNPKYILREWMLVDAYEGAARREEAELFSLYSLIQHPYDEGTAFEEAKYYRRAPEKALTTGGTAFMSCSS